MNEERAKNNAAPFALKDFLALVKIGIVVSNGLTVLAGYWLALAHAGFPRTGAWNLAVLVFLGAASVIAGSCAINNYLDRDIDALMERTRTRPTVTGRAGLFASFGLGSGLILVGTLLLARAGAEAAVLGLVGAFVYIVLYTLWIKRKSVLSSLVGAVAGATPPLIGWAAVEPRLGVEAWLLFALLVVWQQAHVLSLSLKRAAEFRAAGLPLLAKPRGARLMTVLWVFLLLPFPALLVILWQGRLSGAGVVFAAAETALTLAWLGLGLSGLGNDDVKWPRRMFLFSLVYLMMFFGAALVLTWI